MQRTSLRCSPLLLYETQAPQGSLQAHPQAVRAPTDCPMTSSSTTCLRCASPSDSAVATLDPGCITLNELPDSADSCANKGGQAIAGCVPWAGVHVRWVGGR